MCTLALYFQQSARYPLVVAANRDELLNRPATPPLQVAESPWIIAGLDLVAGGTWLGVNEYEVVAGILNRRTSTPVDATRRSRGLLCLETLGAGSVEAARSEVQRAHASAYNPFNLLVATPHSAIVAQNKDARVVTTVLEPGVHLLTNLDLNDPTCPRIATSHALFAAAGRHLDLDDEGDLTALVEALRAVLSDHATPLDPREDSTANGLCVHRGPYGTRSSTILVYSAESRAYRMFHAEGPPCERRYEEVTLPS